LKPDRFHLDQLDILRGLAVLAVVAFHARLPWSSGGFVGVDVFFVLSGFLITRLLVVELEATGTIALRAFEARRVRRLWPALALVVVATLVLGVLLWSPLEWRGLRRDAAAGASYLANISFALRNVAYFDQPLEEGPLLHLWSLGVEEQFYLCWPLILLGTWWLARRGHRDGRRALAGAILGLGAASLAWMIWLVHRRNPHVFFLTPARIWELAVGGLIGLRALGSFAADRARGRFFVAVGLAVFAALLAFPGLRPAEPMLQTIAPVVGTVLLLEGIRLGSRLPLPAAAADALAWIGLYSYGWYLWHWPLVAAAKLEWHTEDPRYLTGASALALCVAVGSKRWLEDPIRFRRDASALGRLPTWAVIGGIVAVVSAALGGITLLGREAFANPKVRALGVIRREVETPAVVARCPQSAFNGECTLGDTSSGRVLVLAGDSHAEQWLPALDSTGRVLGLKVITHILAACPPWPIRVRHYYDEYEDLECERHQRRLASLVAETNATALVLASTVGDADRMIGPLTPEDRARLWHEGVKQLFDSIPGRVRVVIVEKSPHFAFDPVGCLARSAFWRTTPACDEAYGTATGMEAEYTKLEANAASGESRIQMFPTVAPLCRGRSCPAVDGGVVVFRDRFHLTPRYTLTQVSRWVRCLRWAAGLDSGDGTRSACAGPPAGDGPAPSG
jgi:peptidoglycan/LPS O-acetylase OafA/YrhL